MASNVAACFLPYVDSNTRLLLLGSLPGEASLKLQQYYGHPRNQFWQLIGAAIDTDLTSLEYAQKLLTLRHNSIGLWDVIARAERSGSLDQNIRHAMANHLYDLVKTLPNLRAVAFNGVTAAKAGRAQLNVWAEETPRTRILVDLPSSSPANTMPYVLKAKAWRALSHYLA